MSASSSYFVALALCALLLPLYAVSTARAAPLEQTELACAAIRSQEVTSDGGDLKYAHAYWDNETVPDVCEPGDVALHPIRLFEYAVQHLDNSDFIDFGVLRGYNGEGVEKTWIYSYCSYCSTQWGSHGDYSGDAEIWLAYAPASPGRWLWWLRNDSSTWELVRSELNSISGSMELASIMWAGGFVSTTNSELGSLFHNNLYLLRSSQPDYEAFDPTDKEGHRVSSCGPRYYSTYHGSSATICGTFGSVVGVHTNGSATCP